MTRHHEHDQVVRVFSRYTDRTLIGAVCLLDGRTGLVFDDRSIVAVSGTASIVPEHMAASAIEGCMQRDSVAACTLATAEAFSGRRAERAPIFEAPELDFTPAPASPASQARRKVDLRGVDEPGFLSDYDAVGIATAQAKRRTADLETEEGW